MYNIGTFFTFSTAFFSSAYLSTRIVVVVVTASHRGVGWTQVVKPPCVILYLSGPRRSIVSP